MFFYIYEINNCSEVSMLTFTPTRSFAMNAARVVVMCVCVCVCWGYARAPCKNGWTDRELAGCCIRRGDALRLGR